MHKTNAKLSKTLSKFHSESTWMNDDFVSRLNIFWKIGSLKILSQLARKVWILREIFLTLCSTHCWFPLAIIHVLFAACLQLEEHWNQQAAPTVSGSTALAGGMMMIHFRNSFLFLGLARSWKQAPSLIFHQAHDKNGLFHSFPIDAESQSWWL